jgi:hypothetical protein
MVGAVLNDRSIRQFEPTLTTEVNTFLGLILSACWRSEESPLNMTDYFKYLTLDIVGQLAFGHANRTQTRPKGRFLAKGLMISNYHNNVLMQFPFLAQTWLVYLMHRLTARHQQKNLTSLQRMIEKRTKQGIDAKHDLYRAVRKQMEAEGAEDVQLAELWSEAAMLYVAGQSVIEVLGVSYY